MQALERDGLLRVTRIAGTSAGRLPARCTRAASTCAARGTPSSPIAISSCVRSGGRRGPRRVEAAHASALLECRAAAPLADKLLAGRDHLGDLDLPLIVVASDLTNMQPCVYDAAHEPLISCVMDSAGIPFFFRTAPSAA